MRRWGVAAFLVFFIAFIAAMNIDCCDETPQDCPAACHLLCSDCCAVLPTLKGPVPPPPDPLPKPTHEREQAPRLVSLDIEPEKTPPRV